MANILVTGGAGYIGSICSAQLLEHGHSVIVVDNLSTGYRDAVPQGASFYNCDIGDRLSLRRILSNDDVDAVFHFAAKALIPESVANPGLFFEENVASSILFLEELRRAQVRAFIFSSSAAVYGNPEVVPITEDHPKNPVNAYGETKLMLERVLEWYARAYGWGVAAMRYFNACGAANGMGERHEPETHIVPLLLQTASGERSAFQIFGTDYSTPDGTCVRDYVHVLDIVDAHIRVLESLSRSACTPYNIGTGASYSVKDVLRCVEEVTGCRVIAEPAPRRPGDPAVLCASPARLMADFKWKPVNSDLRKIIRTAWEFHRNSLDKQLCPQEP